MTISTTSQPYERLDQWIGSSDKSNWNEYTTELAAKTALVDFDDQLWNRLEQEILQKPEYWQQRCAATLGENRNLNAIKILKLLASKSCFVEVRLNSLYELDWAEVPIEQDYIPIIKELLRVMPADQIEPELMRLLKKAEDSIPID